MKFAVGWRQVAAVHYVVALQAGIVFSSYGVIAASIGRTFIASHSAQMAGVGAIMMFGAIISPMIGSCIDRYPFRWLVAISGGLVAAGLLALSFVQAIWQVIAVYALFMAIPSIICGPMGSSALLMRWFVSHRGRAMGIAMAGLSVGGFIFPFVTQNLIAAFEWRIALRVLAAFAAATMIPAGLFIIVERPQDRRLYPDGACGPPLDLPTAQAGDAHLPLRDLLLDRNFWLAALALGVPLSASTGSNSNFVLAAADIGADAGKAAMAMSIMAASGAFGTLTFAAIGDRFESRLVLIGAMALSATGFFTSATAATLPVLAIGAMMISFASGFINPMWGILFARVFDSAIVGRVMGLGMLVSMVLAMIAPVLFGSLRDFTGAYAVPFMTYGVLIVAVAILSHRIRARSA